MPEAPKLFDLFLPPNSLIAKWSDEEFIYWFGPHVKRHIQQPIPSTALQTKADP